MDLGDWFMAIIKDSSSRLSVTVRETSSVGCRSRIVILGTHSVLRFHSEIPEDVHLLY